MNYSEMSDQEISLSLAKALGIYDFDSNGQVFVWSDKESISSSGMPSVFDPCNSWADIGPLIEQYGLDMLYNQIGEKVLWQANCGKEFKCGLELIESVEPNPKRAAAICLLMLLDKGE